MPIPKCKLDNRYAECKYRICIDADEQKNYLKYIVCTLNEKSCTYRMWIKTEEE